MTNRNELAEKILLELLKKELPRTHELLLECYYPKGELKQSPQAGLAAIAFSFSPAATPVSEAGGEVSSFLLELAYKLRRVPSEYIDQLDIDELFCLSARF